MRKWLQILGQICSLRGWLSTVEQDLQGSGLYVELVSVQEAFEQCFWTRGFTFRFPFVKSGVELYVLWRSIPTQDIL